MILLRLEVFWCIICSNWPYVQFKGIISIPCRLTVNGLKQTYNIQVNYANSLKHWQYSVSSNM